MIFDGSCGFCTWAARWVKRWDRRHRVQLVPFQRPGAPERYGLTREACERAAWAITPDGTYHRGAAAIMVALSEALGCPGIRALYRIPLFRRIADALYEWVAAHRGQLPGTRPYCEEHPEECAGTRSDGVELA
ncbi:thiol-disulfide oxidoreductase DCC family protein [Thermoflexus sp.]|uniref:thiol-disulfide oxidoreductase DCC family protein n=1 Tax=Thermoflexus sp. TaxID=1969742 RepID=UPI0035E3F4D2